MNNKQTGFAGKGYYIALILCAAAIGITGYWYYDSKSTPEQLAAEETMAEYISIIQETAQDIPVIATQPQTPNPTVSAAPRQETQPPLVKKELKTMSPLAGTEIFGYSMEALSYNQTTRDWRVHNGIDLAAEDGAQVVAAADGQVIQAGEDDLLGYSVTIRHVDGYETCYGSLSEELAVAPGDQVVMGQRIGSASATAITESALGSHLHFGVMQNNEPIDPAAFLAVGNH